MTQTWRSARLFFALVWRVAPVRTTITVIWIVVQQTAGVLLALGLGWTVDGVLRHDGELLVDGALTAAVAQAAIAAGWSGLMVQRVMVSQRAGEQIDREVLYRVVTFPTTTHLEDAEQVPQVERARRSGQRMVNSVWTAVSSGVVLLQVALSLALLVSVHWLVAALMLLVAPSLWSAQHGKRLVDHARREAAELDRAERALFEASTNPAQAKEPRLGGGSDYARRRTAELWRHSSEIQVRGEVRGAVVQAAGWVAFLIGYLGALIVTCGLVRAGETTPGSLLLVATLAAQVRGNFAAVVGGVRGSAEGLESLAAYRWLRKLTATSETPLPVPHRLRQGIRFCGVSFRYQEGSGDVLTDIDLDLPAGSTVALVGDHGSGKTTLVNLLCGLCVPSTGEITVDGSPLSRFPAARWRERVTAAFQDFAQFPFLAGESIGVGELAKLHDTSAITEAAKLGKADTVIKDLPEGLRTLLGADFGEGADLSSGQWQRLAMARAFLRRRPLLAVLDEPTAALDAAAEQEIYQSYKRASRHYRDTTGGITVLVSHRFSTIKMCDLIVVLAGGRIVERGSHTELMADGGRYAEMYALQASSYR